MTEPEFIAKNTINIIKDAITDDHIDIIKIKEINACKIIKNELKYFLNNTFVSDKYNVIANKEINGRNFILEVFNDNYTEISSYDRDYFNNKMFKQCNIAEHAKAANTKFRNKTGKNFCPIYLENSLSFIPFTTRQIFYFRSICYHSEKNPFELD